jgi:hypothetical protein
MERAFLLVVSAVIAFVGAAVPVSALPECPPGEPGHAVGCSGHPPKPIMPAAGPGIDAKGQGKPGPGFGEVVTVYTPPEPPPGATNFYGGLHRP